jgi:hypothetical protein
MHLNFWKEKVLPLLKRGSPDTTRTSVVIKTQTSDKDVQKYFVSTIS